jgi:hypothetical protein
MTGLPLRLQAVEFADGSIADVVLTQAAEPVP